VTRVLLALVLFMTVAAPALAQDKAAAQALFDDGRKLLDAGDVAGACHKFEASQKLNPLPGTLLNLANCHEKLGRLATAWGEYKEGLALARADGRKDRIAFAEERLAALGPRVPRLVVELAPELATIADLVVLKDGTPFDAALVGTLLPLDPGTQVVIEARAPGHVAFRTEIVAKESVIETVRIPILAPEPLPQPLPEPPPPVIVLPPPQPLPFPTLPPRAITPPDDATPPLRLAGWITGAIGVAAGVALLATGVYALDQEGAAEDAGCSDTHCPTEEGLTHSDNANAAATVVNVLVPVSIALFGAGLVMVVVPTADETGVTLKLGGAF
jgi:hypothetical protein